MEGQGGGGGGWGRWARWGGGGGVALYNWVELVIWLPFRIILLLHNNTNIGFSSSIGPLPLLVGSNHC